MNERRLLAMRIQAYTVTVSHCEHMVPAQKHWLVQHSSENLGTSPRKLRKRIERIGRLTISPVADHVYICNKIKVDYAC